FLARAFRCSSAALADLKPSFWAISARVGGMPVSLIFTLISSSTSAWRGVRGFITLAPVFLYSTLAVYTVQWPRQGAADICRGQPLICHGFTAAQPTHRTSRRQAAGDLLCSRRIFLESRRTCPLDRRFPEPSCNGRSVAWSITRACRKIPSQSSSWIRPDP